MEFRCRVPDFAELILLTLPSEIGTFERSSIDLGFKTNLSCLRPGFAFFAHFPMKNGCVLLRLLRASYVQ
jgi:hypothetical protein